MDINMTREIHTPGYDGEDRRADPAWHNNKNYFLSIIFLIIGNIGATIWWASSITSDVEVLKAKPDLLERVIRLETSVELHNKYFDKFTISLDNLNKSIIRVDKELERRKTTFEQALREQSRKKPR